MSASQRIIGAVLLCLTFALGGMGFAAPARAQSAGLPQRVTFPSLDGRTMLVGYLFAPAGARSGRAPAIVMMHGRAGAYSSLADGRYDASTLSKRHAFWGWFWAQRGYAALLVDGFGPRGYPQGFPIHSYDERPEAVSEVTVRPLDAYGALRFLRMRPDIDGRRVGLQGWSNGGSTTLITMADATLASAGLKADEGFKAALAFYPACGLQGRFQRDYHPYAPVRIFAGTADEEVSARHCKALVDAARPGSALTIQVFVGATHGFDDPSSKRQSMPENRTATAATVRAAEQVMRDALRP